MLLLAALATSYLVASTVANRLRFQRLFRAKGISWDEAIALTRDGSGFLALDYGVARVMGLPVPAYWWCPATPREEHELFDQIRETGRLLAAPKRSRFEELRNELPRGSIVENRVIVSVIH